jgi:hypothetical protein
MRTPTTHLCDCTCHADCPAPPSTQHPRRPLRRRLRRHCSALSRRPVVILVCIANVNTVNTERDSYQSLSAQRASKRVSHYRATWRLHRSSACAIARSRAHNAPTRSQCSRRSATAASMTSRGTPPGVPTSVPVVGDLDSASSAVQCSSADDANCIALLQPPPPPPL